MSSPSNDLIKKVKEIIDNTRLNITERNFVNDKSKFIIITYWWGRGNINRNTQKPCRELHHIGYNWQLKDDQKLINNPVRFEEMIQTWEDTCRDKNCNFFAQEYPEFAVPGGYQLAINAKPLFIKKVMQIAMYFLRSLPLLIGRLLIALHRRLSAKSSLGYI